MHIHKPSCEESTVIVHILQLRKRRHREDKKLDKGKKHKRPGFEPRNFLLLSENMNYFHGQINVRNSELNKNLYYKTSLFLAYWFALKCCKSYFLYSFDHDTLLFLWNPVYQFGEHPIGLALPWIKSPLKAIDVSKEGTESLTAHHKK